MIKDYFHLYCLNIRILIDQIDWLIISLYTCNSSMVAIRMSCKFWQFWQWPFETFAGCSKITIKRCMAEIHTKHCKRLKQTINNGYMIFLTNSPIPFMFLYFYSSLVETIDLFWPLASYSYTQSNTLLYPYLKIKFGPSNPNLRRFL